MAGWPYGEDNLTTLERAFKPNMDMMATKGEMGLVHNVPANMLPGSDVANLSIFGYDPLLHYRGRASIEAYSKGIALQETEVVFRANLVKIVDGVMKDFTAGHIQSEEASNLLKKIQTEVAKTDKDVAFYAGVSYRNLLVINNRKEQLLPVFTTPPHDITDKQINDYLPKDAYLQGIMTKCAQVLQGAKSEANYVWLWGQGGEFSLPRFAEKYGLSGAVITAVDLIKGIGMAADLQYIEVPGITGFIDTNYKGKAEYALKALQEKDIVFIHVEAPDEAGHMGDAQLKKKAIELIDKELVGTILANKDFEDITIMLLPDHATPLELKTHTGDAVPYIIYNKIKKFDMARIYSEKCANATGIVNESGYKLMERLLRYVD